MVRLDVEDELVFLDISASSERRATQSAWVRAVAERLSIPFTVGGGIASAGEARLLLRAGADKVAVKGTFGPAQAEGDEFGLPRYEAANHLTDDRLFDNLSGQQAYKCLACRLRKPK